VEGIIRGERNLKIEKVIEKGIKGDGWDKGER